jgi:hypothetical protein
VVRRASLGRHYADFPQDAFEWLLAEPPQWARWRPMWWTRCADALRQRGSVLKTSGGYEIFIDQTSGDVLFALRRGAEQLLLAAVSVPIAAGKANVASSTLDPTAICASRSSAAALAARRCCSALHRVLHRLLPGILGLDTSKRFPSNPQLLLLTL